MKTKTLLQKAAGFVLITAMVVLMAQACSERKNTAQASHVNPIAKTTVIAETNLEAELPSESIDDNEINTDAFELTGEEIEPVNEPSVVSMKVCTGVTDREPDNDLQTVDLSQNQVYTFTAIHSDQPDTVYHVYKFEGEEVARVPLVVGASPRWRTWSTKRLTSAWVGEWTVEVQSRSGSLLDAKRFTVLSAPQDDIETEPAADQTLGAIR